ncbi:cytochrome c3 family protein [uncultured Desulfobacter sp.]|uniref:cytochrome c3 family protein n=1 Tax=uncultured Desulfobacter sp. TaxID=240139 RepID=UPI002AAB7835|nr:cytochrome c3 family protein [uncultured Desulfobacter sp.]
MSDKSFTWKWGTPREATKEELAPRTSGCQMCHGTTVELGPDNKPINQTWPGGVGTRYPDGFIGTCTVCHERHTFSKADARKPEACGACHMSGIGELATTHNVQERLKWDLMHTKSVVRSGNRGEGVKGEENMRKICANCHGPTHVNTQRQTLDNFVALYNQYWEGAARMKKELEEKN